MKKSSIIKKSRIKQSIIKAGKAIVGSLPILFSIVLLVSLANVLIPKSFYEILFQGNYFLDPIIGSTIGSILAGNPVTSYVLGGELLTQGVSMIAVTAFLVSWVTVGLIQLPAESILLGKKFTVVRNITAFLFSIMVAILTTIGVGLL